MRNLLNLIKRNSDLAAINEHLRKQNLEMRLDIEILIDLPEGSAAAKILEKYRKRRELRNERTNAIQN